MLSYHFQDGSMAHDHKHEKKIQLWSSQGGGKIPK